FVRVWSTDGGHLEQEYKQHYGPIYSITGSITDAFQSAGWDGVLATGLEPRPPVYALYEEGVASSPPKASIAVSPDATCIAINQTGSIRIWALNRSNPPVWPEGPLHTLHRGSRLVEGAE